MTVVSKNKKVSLYDRMELAERYIYLFLFAVSLILLLIITLL